MIDTLFRQEIATGDVTIYMDDILIATTGSLEQHKQKVHQVLRKLEDNVMTKRSSSSPFLSFYYSDPCLPWPLYLPYLSTDAPLDLCL
jgi:hypothetical protein